MIRNRGVNITEQPFGSWFIRTSDKGVLKVVGFALTNRCGTNTTTSVDIDGLAPWSGLVSQTEIKQVWPALAE